MQRLASSAEQNVECADSQSWSVGFVGVRVPGEKTNLIIKACFRKKIKNKVSIFVIPCSVMLRPKTGGTSVLI